MEANEASLSSGDATTRAQELRANLGARQVAETLLAEAGRVRQDAALAADAMVEEAQELSSQLLAESRRAAEQINEEARERADDLLARARVEAHEVAERARAESEEVAERTRAGADAIRAAAEADIEEHRRRVRAEVTAQVTRDLTEQHRLAEVRAREESEALISDLEASVRILGVSLQSAVANVSELLASLEVLRSTADPEGTHVEVERPEPETWARDNASLAPGAGDQRLGETLSDGRRQPSAPVTAVPSATSQFGTEPDEPEMPADRPRTATEAFLTSSSLEIEQASRELRDLQHPEETRRRRSEESRLAAQRRDLEDGPPDDDPDPDPTDGTRPLGWLFRTAQ